jgi:ribosomal protein S18 acetylase RimI-like enzyme
MMNVRNQVDIFPATDADIDALADLQWMWRIDEWHRVPMYDRIDFRGALREWIGLHGESHHAFVARSNTEVVGMAWLAVIQRVPTPAQFIRLGGHIQSLYVTPAMRRQGVGNALMKRLVDTAKERDLHWLLVHPSDQSFGFYRAHGFVPTGRFLELRLAPG